MLYDRTFVIPEGTLVRLPKLLAERGWKIDHCADPSLLDEDRGTFAAEKDGCFLMLLTEFRERSLWFPYRRRVNANLDPVVAIAVWWKGDRSAEPPGRASALLDEVAEILYEIGGWATV